MSKVVGGYSFPCYYGDLEAAAPPGVGSWWAIAAVRPLLYTVLAPRLRQPRTAEPSCTRLPLLGKAGNAPLADSSYYIGYSRVQGLHVVEWEGALEEHATESP
jgi:hypothetical protein